MRVVRKLLVEGAFPSLFGGCRGYYLLIGYFRHMPFSREKRAHTFFMVVVFASFGIAIEVFFTAAMAIVNRTPVCDKPLVALEGHSYVWMAFIYGLIPVLGVLFYNRVKDWPALFRLPFYVVIIYIVEFTSGYLLQITTGSCPWHYTSGLNIMGLIRLDYFPAWLLFVWLVERLYVFMDKRVIR